MTAVLLSAAGTASAVETRTENNGRLIHKDLASGNERVITADIPWGISNFINDA